MIRCALAYAAEEMGVALRKAAYSPNIKERMDLSCAIFDPELRLAVQAEHIPVHLGSMALAVRRGLEEYGGELNEGDMLAFNDPYISGTHLPDITFIAPVYHRGELIAYVANKAHHSDVGGVVPGSMPGDARELIQEGLVIPPVKLVRGGELDRELCGLILSNVRTPEVRLGDLRAQVAANNIGVRRVAELCERYGPDVLRAAMEEAMSYSEKRMRARIREMPEGTYEAEDWLEDTGVGDEPARIKVTITIKGDTIIFDYAGTSPQVDGPVNAVLGVTLAGVYYVLLSVTDPTIPVNDGCFRPVDVRVPEGCLLNPRRPAPVSAGNVETSQRNVDALLLAFSKIVPHKVCAAGQGTMNNVTVGGINKEGRQWTFYETVGGGYGARPGLDGVDGVHVHMTNTMNTPIEAVEREFPIRFLKYELRPDSGGPGKWRGGCGIERSWQLLSGTATLSLQCERHKLAPWALAGGKPGATGEALIIKRGGVTVKLRPKCTVELERGDIFVIRTPGGGGYGDPLERDPEFVLSDVLDGLVSPESAKRDYGVAVKGGKLDRAATEELRRSLRRSER